MKRLNFFSQEGYLTNKQRKEPLEHRCGYFTFTSCIDLSKGVTVTGKGTQKQLTEACVSFGVWWGREIHRSLNGFSGTDTVSYDTSKAVLL
jgi:hypothetical protein